MLNILLVFFILLTTLASAKGEIEKYVLTCENSICFYWWPKLPTIKGWHQDIDASYEMSVHALAPDGREFGEAETVMYAEAAFKERVPESKSLRDFIKNDHKRFLASDPEITIAESGSLSTSDGQKLQSFTFFPKNKGNWERVSYGEEGDFYLVFTVSSRTRSGYENTLGIYEDMVRHYKEKLDKPD